MALRVLSVGVVAVAACATIARSQESGSIAERLLASAPAEGESEPMSIGLEQSFDEANVRERLGYLRASGMLVSPSEDASFLDGSGTIGVDDGFGMTFAVGMHVPQAPISIEVEYAFRQFNTDDYLDPSTGRLGDTEFFSHTLALNGLLDTPDLIGPVGFYGGGGVGFRMSELSYSSGGGRSSTEIEGNEFFWQIMAGVTVSVSEQIQLYGGARWSDAGDVEDDVIRLDLESTDIEVGLRFFF
jgi:opacity protein-like surface antigen